MRHAIFAAPLALSVCACSIKEAKTALSARSDLVGVSEQDLSLCAGLPSKTERVDNRTELREYEFKSSDAKAVNFNIPVIGGGVNVGEGGVCDATFKMVDGRVATLRYSGDTDSGPGGTDAVCAPIVQHCLAELPPRTAAQ